MPSEFPKAIWSGIFTVWGIELRCHVLDTGERVIEADSMNKFIVAMEEGAIDPYGDLDAFIRWQRGLS